MPHDYPHQTEGLRIGAPYVCDPYDHIGESVMLSAPTGSGKSRIANGLQAMAKAAGVRCVIFSSRPNILEGLAEKQGVWSSDSRPGSQAEVERRLRAADLWTPLLYINAIARGEITPADVGVFDEGHHGPATTWREAKASVGSAVALTATPYRGNPRSTQELREQWGPPRTLLTLKESVDNGYTSLPTFNVSPIFNDDKLDTAGDDFNGTQMDAMVTKGLSQVLDDVQAQWHHGTRIDWHDRSGRHVRRPAACLILPSRAVVRTAIEQLEQRGIDATELTADTPMKDRPEIFRRCVAGETIMVTVAVLAEGVDLPLELMFCARPMNSPVASMQLWGRMTRPGLSPVIFEYSRNLERFAHLWHGFMPIECVAQIQTEFGGPSKRAAHRSLDLEKVEGLSSFKVIPIQLHEGLWASMYCIYKANASAGEPRGEYIIISAPHLTEPVVAFRPHNRGQWLSCTLPADVIGYRTSSYTQPMRPKQRDWWKRAANGKGMDAGAEVSARAFAALPALVQSGQHLRRN